MNDILTGIDTDADFFSNLYGVQQVDENRKRYKTLVSDMSAFPASELSTVTGDFRIFSAPGRTELAGNHTDHNRGKVLAASVHLDVTAIVKKREDKTVFFRSSGFPDVKINLLDNDGSPDLLPKPEETGTTESLIRGIAAEFEHRGCPVGGFSVNADSRVLPGSGLSSSAALEALFARIFDSLYGDANRSPLEIAQIGQIAENKYFGKPCGLMDQTACASGGTVAIDFKDGNNVSVTRINFDPLSLGYILCVLNTGSSHADLTADYASIPAEMKSIAAFFGRQVLRELDKETILSHTAELRKNSGDRALLRALHFFDENERVEKMSAVLSELATATEKLSTLHHFLQLVNESGDSSWELLQNVYSRADEQSVSLALALSRDFFRTQKITGAARIHGGGFAGTIQVYIPHDAFALYKMQLEKYFGQGSVIPLQIRPVGAIEGQFLPR
jgi:galactokinase